MVKANKEQNRIGRMAKRALALFVSSTFIASALTAEVKEDDILLKVITADGTIERFTRERLDSLEQYEFSTTTLWTTGSHKYAGPSFQSVIDEAGIEADRLELTGVNGYSLIMDRTTDPVTDEYPIIATKIDDAEFEIWEKGPLWNIYDFDNRTYDEEERATALSVWQLVSIREIQSDDASKESVLSLGQY